MVQISSVINGFLGSFDAPHQPFMFPGADHLAPFRARGRGFFAMPPMRGMPRFRGRPFGPDPFLDQNMRRYVCNTHAITYVRHGGFCAVQSPIQTINSV